MALDKASWMADHYRFLFQRQRKNIVNHLSRFSGYENLRKASNIIATCLKDQMEQNGFTNKKCVFALDGSFLFGVGTWRSDFDGAVMLLNNGDSVEIEEKNIDDVVKKFGHESNIRVLGASIPLEDPERFAKLEDVASNIGMLLAGTYLIGEYREGPIVNLLRSMSSWQQQIVEDVWEYRMEHIREIAVQKYVDRIRNYSEDGACRLPEGQHIHPER